MNKDFREQRKVYSINLIYGNIDLVNLLEDKRNLNFIQDYF